MRVLPEPPARDVDEPAEFYGGRLVAWLLQGDGHRPIMLSDEQAARALWSCTSALAQRIVLGTGDDAQSTPAIVYDHIETVRGELGALIARRARLDAAEAAADVPAVHIDAEAEGGRKAPLLPKAPSYPPAPVYASPRGVDIRF